MYANTIYNHVYYEQCTLNITLFARLECPSIFCITYVPIHQTYCSPNKPSSYTAYIFQKIHQVYESLQKVHEGLKILNL